MEKDNPFKEIYESSKEAPAELKEKVMKGVAAAQLLKDMASLFTSNYKSTFGTLFFTKNKNKNN